MEKYVYLSYDDDDLELVNFIRAKVENLKDDLYFVDYGSKPVFALESSIIVREKIKKIMESSKLVVCLIGYSTCHNKWVNWEVNTGAYLEKMLIGVRLHDIYMDQVPSSLQDHNAKIISADTESIFKAIKPFLS